MYTFGIGGLSGLMFNFAPIFIGVIFIMVVGTLITGAVKGAHQWKKNNDSPVLTVDATVVSKRSDVSHTHHSSGTDNMSSMSSSTTYYVTFQVDSGSRMEFMVGGAEYGMLVEQDTGKLTFQGTRYLGFERSAE